MRGGAGSEQFRGDVADARHGTENGYGNLGCRCLPCKTAHAHYTREYLQARRVGLTAANGGIAPGERKHGKAATYHNWRCQCRPCLDAHNAERAQQRSRSRRTA